MGMKDYAGHIGKTVLLTYPDGMLYSVKIIDVDVVYGSLRYQVESSAGTSVWVDAKRIKADTA